MKTLFFLLLPALLWVSSPGDPEGRITRSVTIDSLGAGQGVSIQGERIFLYGDREVGVIREYRLEGDSLTGRNREIRLTINNTDVINHPTGIAYRENMPVFIGNSVRLNKEGTQWKALIYHVNWDSLLQTGTLDGNLLKTIPDDACIQGTRPEYVRFGGKWYVATADYGDKANEVRLYDPKALKNAGSTADPGVLFKKFTCSPWVQNLYWMADQGILVLIQNQIEGRRWRLTFVDLEKSIASGKEQVIKVVDTDRTDELEGFSFTGQGMTGIAVTSSRRNNVNLMELEPVTINDATN